MSKTLVIILSLLAGPTISATSRAEASVRIDCAMPPGWAGVARRKPRFIVFGELHGTREGPAIVGNIACALAMRGEKILVAVEHDASFDPAYQAAWRQPPATFAAALLQAGWKGKDDGTTSVAMLAMLKRLHRLAWQGRAIRIVAFNGPRDDAQRRKFSALPAQGGHDAAQAENIRIAADAGTYDLVLVLTGNVHARKRPFDRGTAFEPMAMHLARAAPTVTLDVRYSRGSAWTCGLKPSVIPEPGKPIPNDAIECAIHPLTAQPDLGRAPFLSLAPAPGADGAYDGSFWLGAVSASPPALSVGSR